VKFTNFYSSKRHQTTILNLLELLVKFEKHLEVLRIQAKITQNFRLKFL
jgi:hypothetical protein